MNDPLHTDIQERMRKAPVRYLDDEGIYHLLNNPTMQVGYIYRMFNTKESYVPRRKNNQRCFMLEGLAHR